MLGSELFPTDREKRLEYYGRWTKLFLLASKKNTNDSRTYDNIQGQGDDYAAGYLLDHSSFKKHYKMIAIDLSKQ